MKIIHDVKSISAKRRELLIRHAGEKAPEPEQVLITPELILRDSVSERKNRTKKGMTAQGK